MADAPKKPNLMGILAIFVVILILFDPRMRGLLVSVAGFVLEPLFGFDGKYPVLTLLLTGTVMVLLTTLVRHFTTDWLTMARTQATMREFQKEFGKARKENNTYRMKKLQDQQPEIMKMQQEMSSKQLKLMPLTLIVVMPFFTWMLLFLQRLDYAFFAAPWNSQVDMFTTEGILFGTSVFPHWILLYTALSIPLGSLAQKTMKYLSWKERWKAKHPEVHE